MNFIIVILNGCTIQQLNKIAHTGFVLGKYHAYSIEVHQMREICEKYNTQNRSIMDIINGNEDLDRYPSPARISVIDPTSLFKPRIANSNTRSLSHPNSNTSLAAAESSPANIEDFAQKMAKILQDRKVIEILQAQLQSNPAQHQSDSPMQNNNTYQQTSQFEQSLGKENMISRNSIEAIFDEFPVFKPSKVLDYNHEHIPTLEEQLMEFRVIRMVEYNHRETPKLRDFIKDVDVDKIIEKRKAVALRKKILEYLKNAERPEDTVSNPKYPKNWEMIVVERPPRKNKRRKLSTPKIKRILLERSREENAWMTKGYTTLTTYESVKMDLEEISSEDEDMEIDDKIPNKIQIVQQPQKPSPLPEYMDEYKNIQKTTPDFNHFNHCNVLDIKKIMWLPDRDTRPYRILIILRGCSGAGKSHLVQLIKRKESEMKNTSNIRILSIDDYFLTEDDEECNYETQMKLTQSYLDEMQKYLKKTISEGLYNFIIVDAENCDLNSYTQFYQIGASMNFTVYTIELYQSLDICSKQSKRPSHEISKSIEMLEQNRIPSGHVLLIASALYADYNCFVNPKVLNSQMMGETEENNKNADDYKKYIKYLVQPIDLKCLSPMPQFNWHSRDIIRIEEILEEPGRANRSENIAILLRGPGGSGKKELAAMIIEKERHYGNERAKFINFEDYFINETTQKYEFNSRLLDANMSKLMRQLRELLRLKECNFLIIDAETGDFTHYKQIHELISSYQYKCHTIELYQDAFVCEKNDVHNRDLQEIENVLEDIQLNPTPNDHILINASSFFKETSSLSSLDRPLKSALKISPNTSLNIKIPHNKIMKRSYDEQFSKLNVQQKFQSHFNQRININGEFVQRNSQAPAKHPEFNWFNQEIMDIQQLFDEPSHSRRIIVFVRGCPGAGKSYLAKLIERKQHETGKEKEFKLLSVDQYFERQKFFKTEIDNQYEKYIECTASASKMNDYMELLKKNFLNLVKKKQFSFVVVDGDFCDLKHYNEMWSIGVLNNYSCYKIELHQDDDICLKYNDHKWDDDYVLKCNDVMRKIQTPDEHLLLDPEHLYGEFGYKFTTSGDLFIIDDEHMVDISDVSDDEDDILNSNEDEDDSNFETSFGKFKMSAMSSKWDDVETPNIDRLDGTLKKSSQRFTMADYLQSDEWSMRPSTCGKKRVRWADIEEKIAQERMREIGFIVGHTDWKRMVDDSDGKSALEKTKFIEPRQKN